MCNSFFPCNPTQWVLGFVCSYDDVANGMLQLVAFCDHFISS